MFGNGSSEGGVWKWLLWGVVFGNDSCERVVLWKLALVETSTHDTLRVRGRVKNFLL